MLDIKQIKNDLDTVQKGMDKRGAKIDFSKFLTKEDKRKALLLEIEELRRQRNTASDEIGAMKKSGQDAGPSIEKMRQVSDQIKTMDKALSAIEEEIRSFLISLPNLPHKDVPKGRDDTENRLEKTWGTPREFDFKIKDHADIGEDLGILDLARATKLAGSRFPLYLGQGARLERALINFMLDIHTGEHGYTEALPPFIVNRTTMTGTGQLPKFEEDLFKLEGLDYYLIPTSEVPVTNIYAKEILNEEDLPLKFTAYTPCFRSEAGSYGRDTKGLIRQHQFNKVEMVKITSAETSFDELESLLANAETILQRLELPYQVVTLCTGDLGFSATKTYDIEVWMPGQDKYREISSCSNCLDFQARRANIKYRAKDAKKPLFCHTLNGSGLAVGRTFAAILENYQQADGSVKIPDALVPYMGGIEVIENKVELFPEDVRAHIIPDPKGELYYKCLGCGAEHGIEKLLYVCPECNQVLLIHDRYAADLKSIDGKTWQRIFDYRKMLKIPALKGIYRYHEFIGPSIPLDSILYLGEGHTPMVEANAVLQEKTGVKFFYKNDGQNPSASFKDRGMASALSAVKYLVDQKMVSDVIAVCASTGDTSAAAALYASYLGDTVKSAVLLPHKKVTSAQLAQPLGSGARVFEIPGVFDDCMKVVEDLSSKYPVVLLNSKNAWRILGQESYSYEIAQDFDWDLKDKVVMVPIGNAGNISAVMNGFLKFYKTGIIDTLPKIVGVQSEHADPVFQYYKEKDPEKRVFKPKDVLPSVAQAAMIGNPVSMPRVIQIAQEYDELSNGPNIFVVQVAEQDIMDWQLTANQNGHITCTQGGECLAGLVQARAAGIITPSETVVLDATAHAIKFSGFQDLYFKNQIPENYGITPKPEYINLPDLVAPVDPDLVPSQDKRLEPSAFNQFVNEVSGKIAQRLGLLS